MTVQDPLVGRLTQAVRQLGESRPLTWRACHAIRDMLGAHGASITIENSSIARVTLCASDEIAGWLCTAGCPRQTGPHGHPAPQIPFQAVRLPPGHVVE
jgi:hypothetical protein